MTNLNQVTEPTQNFETRIIVAVAMITGIFTFLPPLTRLINAVPKAALNLSQLLGVGVFIIFVTLIPFAIVVGGIAFICHKRGMALLLFGLICLAIWKIGENAYLGFLIIRASSKDSSISLISRVVEAINSGLIEILWSIVPILIVLHSSTLTRRQSADQ